VQLPTPEFTGAPSESTEPVAIAVAAPPAPVISSPVSDASSGIFSNGRSLEWLQQRLLSLNTGRYASLRPGMYFLDLETGNYLSIGGDRVVPTASVIKLPILIAFFQEVEAGRIRLDETLVMTRDVLVGESGYMQNQPVGSKFSALQTATNMIITSDNTATNMIIKRIGGFEAVNRRFRSWGLQKTMVRNKLPDLGATNKTTAKELVQLLAMVEQGKLLAAPARQQALDILRRVRNKRLLPVGLGPGAAIAHKTGYIRSVLGDAGIIYMPNGKRYLAAVLVENNAAPATARGYIQEVSRIVYAYMAQASGISAAASLPAQSDAIAPTNEAPETD
jgi:beta-lactamase class A